MSSAATSDGQGGREHCYICNAVASCRFECANPACQNLRRARYMLCRNCGREHSCRFCGVDAANENIQSDSDVAGSVVSMSGASSASANRSASLRSSQLPLGRPASQEDVRRVVSQEMRRVMAHLASTFRLASLREAGDAERREILALLAGIGSDARETTGSLPLEDAAIPGLGDMAAGIGGDARETTGSLPLEDAAMHGLGDMVEVGATSSSPRLAAEGTGELIQRSPLGREASASASAARGAAPASTSREDLIESSPPRPEASSSASAAGGAAPASTSREDLIESSLPQPEASSSASAARGAAPASTSREDLIESSPPRPGASSSASAAGGAAPASTSREDLIESSLPPAGERAGELIQRPLPRHEASSSASGAGDPDDGGVVSPLASSTEALGGSDGTAAAPAPSTGHSQVPPRGRFAMCSRRSTRRQSGQVLAGMASVVNRIRRYRGNSAETRSSDLAPASSQQADIGNPPSRPASSSGNASLARGSSAETRSSSLAPVAHQSDVGNPPGRPASSPGNTNPAREPHLSLPENPLELLEEHDRQRVAHRGDECLWTLDELHPLPRTYMYPVPTFGAPGWKPPQPITQEEYSSRFENHFPIAARVLPFPGVIVAGGAAAWPITKPPGTSGSPGDIDFFFVGVEELDQASLWRKAADLRDRICWATQEHLEEAFDGDAVLSDIVEVLNPGVLSLHVTLEKERRLFKTLRFQIILRAHPSTSVVLHNFDLGSCSVAFDGEIAQTTLLGAYASVYGVNLINPAYRSGSFERRVMKYFDRGYSLGLVHLDLADVRADESLDLAHVRLTCEAVRGHRITGSLALVAQVEAEGLPRPAQITDPSARLDVRPRSGDDDYGPPFRIARLNNEFDGWKPRSLAQDLSAAMEWSEWKMCRSNLKQLNVGGWRYSLVHQSYYGQKFAREPHRLRLPSTKLPLRTYGEREPGLADLIDISASLIDVFSRRLQVDPERLNLRRLSRILRDCLGMTHAQITRLLQEVIAVSAEHPEAQLNVVRCLEPFKVRVEHRYHVEAGRPIEWWFVADAGRRLNHQPEEPETWYGSAYSVGFRGSPPESVRVQSLVGELEDTRAAGQRAFDGQTCVLCLESIANGGRNVITLPCGHSFHWSMALRPGGCRGLQAWMARAGSHGEGTTCPVCSTQGDEESRARGASGEHRAGEITIEIDWGELL